MENQIINTNLLHQMVRERYVSVKKHATLGLYIYNYTAKTQYDRVWNDITLCCRGLILDEDYNIVARPFPKFFNLEEHDSHDIPKLPFRVYDKMDGSLGIIYYYAGQWRVATRGAFASKQALWAQQALYSTYATTLPLLDIDNTYLVEIIYPANRVVVDYGGQKALVLLAIIDNKTGQDVAIEDIGLPIVEEYSGVHDFETLKALNLDNKEGFVLHFENGFRLKIKFEEYVRLHRIVNQISSVVIWEHLKNEQDMSSLLELIPDEMYDWIKKVETTLRSQYTLIEQQAQSEFKVLSSRKETALYFLQCQHPHVMFRMLENKDYSDKIWQKIRPPYYSIGQ